MNDSLLPPDEARAYREAGHAVMARELGLPCHRPDGMPHYQFATFHDYCRQASQARAARAGAQLRPLPTGWSRRGALAIGAPPRPRPPLGGTQPLSQSLAPAPPSPS
ncbi:MAG: hypothetical protein JNL18_23025 [Planctomycetaceae bacterium]|nr:hypothetical protein [Planctomycetaceae bacterium]